MSLIPQTLNLSSDSSTDFSTFMTLCGSCSLDHPCPLLDLLKFHPTLQAPLWCFRGWDAFPGRTNYSLLLILHTFVSRFLIPFTFVISTCSDSKSLETGTMSHPFSHAQNQTQFLHIIRMDKCRREQRINTRQRREGRWEWSGRKKEKQKIKW